MIYTVMVLLQALRVIEVCTISIGRFRLAKLKAGRSAEKLEKIRYQLQKMPSMRLKSGKQFYFVQIIQCSINRSSITVNEKRCADDKTGMR